MAPQHTGETSVRGEIGQCPLHSSRTARERSSALSLRSLKSQCEGRGLRIRR